MTGDRLILTDARPVLSDRVLDRATVVVEDGRISEIVARRYPPGPGVVDLGRRLLLPGLVDLHNDAIEAEINPRPGANFAPAFALRQLDRKLAAAGVTTQFHAVSFSERDIRGRSLGFAAAVTEALAELRADPATSIDHHPLLRLDTRTPGALAAVLAVVPTVPLPLVSLNDHVPGQGQFKDIGAYRRYISRDAQGTISEAKIDALVEDAIREAAATEAIVEATLRDLAEVGDWRGVSLASHDDDSAARVELMHRLGCSIAEFPLTLEAAARARALGMKVAMGAANALRGGSLSGNVGSRELLADGLVDILVADYYAPALLAAVFRLVELGLADLPAATRLVTANPAAAVGLTDRGEIAVGRRADLIVVDAAGADAAVAATLVDGRCRAASFAVDLPSSPFAAESRLPALV